MPDPQVALTFSYHKQLIDRLRNSTNEDDLKLSLLIKMLEEKGVIAVGEVDKRWPQYLKHDVGAIGPDGKMSGTLSVRFYNEK